jgi:hypothetical protein
MLDMVTMLEDQGKRSSYISNMLKAAKSWFRFNHKHLEVDIKLSHESGLFDREKPPIPAEMRRILDTADVRQKVGISLMAFSGFRDQVLGDFVLGKGPPFGTRRIKASTEDSSLPKSVSADLYNIEDGYSLQVG